MRTPTLTLALAAALSTGCADLISNGIFAEDLVFLEALPDQDRHTVDLDEEYDEDEASARAPEDDCALPDLLCLSQGIGQGINGNVMELLNTVDYVRSMAPTERTQDTRTWGPYEVEEGQWMRLDMERQGGLFAWAFSAGSSSLGPWTTFYAGEHYRGVTVAEGVGAFWLDYQAMGEVSGADWTGMLEVDYSNELGKELYVTYDDVRVDDMTDAIDADYWYWGDGDGGDLEFRTPADFNENGTLEQLEIRTRWLFSEGGRGDARVSGGDVEELGDIEMTQCWGRFGLLSWQYDNQGMLPIVGEESACVFEDRAEIDHI